MKRKAVQLVGFPCKHEGMDTIVTLALCTDGTIWCMEDNSVSALRGLRWVRLPSIPDADRFD